MEKDIIFFDGVCNLCASSVQWVIRHDKKNHFVFSSLQSEYARKHLLHQLPAGIDSIVLLRKGKVYIKSTAVLKIAGNLGFPISLASIFLIVPAFLRNLIYDFIAKNRYHWFGKKNQCWLPDPELNSKFIE